MCPLPWRNGDEETMPLCYPRPPKLSLSSLSSPPPRVSRLASEKRELEAQLGRSREEALAGRAARQEAEALRGLVRTLELELRQERGLGYRGSGRRSQDSRRLAKEVRERGGWQGRPAGTQTCATDWTSAPLSIPAAGGGEGVREEPARPAEDAELRAGHLPEGVRGVALVGGASEQRTWPGGGPGASGAESEGRWAGPALDGEGRWNLSGRGWCGRRGLMDCVQCRELGKVSAVW